MRNAFFILIATLSLLWAGCHPSNPAPAVSGTIETDEAHLASRYGGRVERVLVLEGGMLTNNQPLVELAAAELRATHAEAAAQLAELEAGPRAEEKAAAKNEWEAQIAEWDLAKAEAARGRELFEGKTISAAERDRLTSRAATLEKSVAAAKSRYDLLLAGTRAERITQAKARMNEIESHLKEMVIYAPTNCILEVLNVKVGDVLAPNREVATVLFPQHLWVRVYVPETWLGFIKPNAAVKVRVDSFPATDFDGRIEQVSRTAEFTPRNTQTVAERIKQVFAVKVELNNGQDKLRAGMAADVYFTGVPPPPKD